MAKKSKDVYGAEGQSNLLAFDPDTLVLFIDETSPLYDERVHLPVDENLAKNIDYQGVLQPISVLKNPETGKTEVAVGRQRVKAARLANEWRRARGEPIVLVPGIVYAGKRQNALDAIVSENEARQADTPLGRAEKMRRQLAMGRGEDQIAIIFNCNVKTVRDTLALLECTAAVRNAIEGGKIKLTHAKALSKLEPAEQRTKVAELIAAGDGAKPHERARRQAAVIDGDKPRARTKKEINAALEAASRRGLVAYVLRWVLGLETELPSRVMELPSATEVQAALDAQIEEREAA